MSFSSGNQSQQLQQQQSSKGQAFDLDDFDDDLLELSNDLDLLSFVAKANGGGQGLESLTNGAEPTLESILNESDNETDDELLKSFAQSLSVGQASSLVAASERREAASETGARNEDASSLRRSATQSSSLSAHSSSRASSFTQQQAVFKSNLIEQNGIVCKQASLKQISSQLISAIERADAGLPTCLAVSQLVAVGTSRGLVLIFDSNQILKLYLTSEHKDAISALSFNNKCDRLLAGNATGIIFMYDSLTGKCLRQIEEAHPQGNPILNIKFTDDSKLACFLDSGGSVFMLEFKRIMGVRGADSTCLFAGSRGEVIALEPLKFEKFAESIAEKLSTNTGNNHSGLNASVRKNLDNVNELFSRYSILAMASFTKVFVVTLRPKLTVLFTYPLTGNAKYLPILNWQFVIIQKQIQAANGNNQAKRFVCPILACARESTIHFFQIEYYNQESSSSPSERKSNGAGRHGNEDAVSYQGSLDNENDSASDKRKVPLQQKAPSKRTSGAHDPLSSDGLSLQFKFIQIQKSTFDFKILNFCWLNAKTIAILDNMERLHIVDVRTNMELQIFTNLHECVQLVYNSSFFKSLANGGNVSEALAYAGESACYQTFQAYMGKLFMLGKNAISMFSLQNWSTRIDDFVNENKLDIALDLGLAMYNGETKALVGLPLDSVQRKEKISDKLIDVLYLYVNRAMKQDCPTSGKLDVLEKHYRKCSIKCVKICMAISRQDILFDNLYNLLSCDKLFEGYFLECLEEYVLRTNINVQKPGGPGGALSTKQLDMPPLIIKNFIDYYAIKSTETPSNTYLARLEKCVLHFDIAKIDLHNVIQMCRKYKLIDAFIYLFNKAFNDYITPLEELIMMMKKPHYFLTYDTAKLYLKELQVNNKPQTASAKTKQISSIDDYEPEAKQASSLHFTSSSAQPNTSITDYGNKLLVYLHCCLCGQSYPYGTIEDDQMSDKVRRYTFDYLIGKTNPLIDKLIAGEKEEINSTTSKLPRTQLDRIVYEILVKNDANDLSLICSYPILKILINYDLLDFLNVISMSFNEPSFEAVIGLDKKQQFIDILVDISGLNTSNSANLNRVLKDSSNARYLTLSDDLTGHMFTFFARQIANKNNSIQIDNNIFAQVNSQSLGLVTVPNRIQP